MVIDLMSANLEAPLFGEDAGVFNPHRTVAARAAALGLGFDGIRTCLGAILPAVWACQNKVRHPTSALITY